MEISSIILGLLKKILWKDSNKYNPSCCFFYRGGEKVTPDKKTEVANYQIGTVIHIITTRHSK